MHTVTLSGNTGGGGQIESEPRRKRTELECFLQCCIRRMGGNRDSERTGNGSVNKKRNCRGDIADFNRTAEIHHSEILSAGRNAGTDFQGSGGKPANSIGIDFSGNSHSTKEIPVLWQFSC